MPVTAWLPGNFQVLSITWCLYCVALSDATETEPTRKPVRVLCVWRLASIINPSPTFLVGISPVKRKSSEFNKFGLAYVNPCPQFEGELYINFQTAVLRTLPLVAAYHSVVVVPVMVCRLAVSGPLPRLGVNPIIDSQSLRIIFMNYTSKHLALLLARKLHACASTTTKRFAVLLVRFLLSCFK